MSRNQAKEKVIKFGRLLRQEKFNFSHIYMFGSVAKNGGTKDSRIEPILLTEADIKKESSLIPIKSGQDSP